MRNVRSPSRWSEKTGGLPDRPHPGGGEKGGVTSHKDSAESRSLDCQESVVHLRNLFPRRQRQDVLGCEGLIPVGRTRQKAARQVGKRGGRTLLPEDLVEFSQHDRAGHKNRLAGRSVIGDVSGGRRKTAGSSDVPVQGVRIRQIDGLRHDSLSAFRCQCAFISRSAASTSKFGSAIPSRMPLRVSKGGC